MPDLKLSLLGPPQLKVDNTPVVINRHKVVALLAYLAVTGKPQQRDKLAALFWPNSPSSRARASLRRDLSVLNKSVGDRWLNVERETIGLRHDGLWLDTAEFHGRLAECERHGHATDVTCAACLPSLVAAAELYHDDFLAGFSLTDCPDFDEWQFFQAEELRQELAAALRRLVQGHSTRGDVEQAIHYARRWLALDPLHEPAHRQLMLLYGQAGQRSAAQRQYRICVQTLDDELGVAPAAETTALYQHLLAANLDSLSTGRGSGDQPRLPDASAKRHNLPEPATPFVGRVVSLAEIAQRLHDPACRLLTLVGPGGIGKTRLALQAAWNWVDDILNQGSFRDGVYLVRLASISSPGHLITAMADALNFSFYKEVESTQQLVHYLREKEMLLVLDNFEHLLTPASPILQSVPDSSSHAAPEATGAAELVANILTSATRVKFLVTSRVALSLSEEWIFPVEGLRYPARDATSTTSLVPGLESYSAVQLFTQVARRVHPDFSLVQEQDCVLEICRQVEGVPLAIELAAAWVKAIPCAQIAREIERSLDFLTTSLRDVPARHRSLRAVFAHSWQILTPNEQDVLRRLSVFRGGFRQDAAAQIAGASLLDLAALVEKSLLIVNHDSRYRMHGLLRQFGSEKLAKIPQEMEETQNRHAAYYIAYLREREKALQHKQQKHALAEIRQELKNVRAAWDWVVTQGNIKAIEQGLDTLFDFFWISSRFQEGAETFRKTAERLQDAGVSESVWMRLIGREGAFHASLGTFVLARELLQKNLSLAQRLQARSEIAFSLNLLGNVVNIQGESGAAAQLYQESLEISRELVDQAGTASSLYNLGRHAVGQGEYQQAQRYFQESLILYGELENQAGIAHVRYSLGMTGFFLGGYAEAERNFQDCLALFKELDDRHGIALALSGMGLIAWGIGGPRLLEAQQLVAESLQINRAIGHRLEVASRLAYLGSITNSLADFEVAQQYLNEALSISREIGHIFGITWSLVGLGTAARSVGNLHAAREYFSEAIDFAVTSQDTPILLDALTSLAGLLAQQGMAAESRAAEEGNRRQEGKEWAVRIVTLVSRHRAAWQISKDKAAELLVAIQADLDPEVVSAATAWGQSKSLVELMDEITTTSGITSSTKGSSG